MLLRLTNATKTFGILMNDASYDLLDALDIICV